MKRSEISVDRVRKLYDERAGHGAYGTLAPGSGGRAKSRYVSEVFDAVLLPRLAALPVRGTVLDYGCGTGILTTQLAGLFTHVVGADISEEMLGIGRNEAARLDNISFLTIDGYSLPQHDGYFDAVVARESLCHVADEDLAALVEEIARVLKPGGAFYWLEQSAESKRWRDDPAAPYVVKRSIDELVTVAEAAGLTVRDLRLVRRPRFPWIYLVSTGFVPQPVRRFLARSEAAINRHDRRVRSKRWHDVLLTCVK